MRKICLLFLCILLIGCSSEASVKIDLDQLFNNVDDIESRQLSNMHRDYFDYYLPRHIGKISSDLENASFISNGVHFYMNLNISSIIVEEYYSFGKAYGLSTNKYAELKNIGTPYYTRFGEFEDTSGIMKKYGAYVNALTNGKYFVYFEYNNVDFASVCNLSEIENLFYDIVVIGKSVKVNNELVTSTFSNKINIVINKQYNLFEKVLPESGVILDVLYPEEIKPDGGTHQPDEAGEDDNNAHEGKIEEEEDAEN